MAPSSGMTAPLMKAAAGEQRNATVAATSSARPRRPIGVLRGHHADDRRRGRRTAGATRANRPVSVADGETTFTRTASARVLDRGLLREVVERALRRAVRGVAGRRRSHRAPNRAARPRRRRCATSCGIAVLHAEERALEVDVEHALPLARRRSRPPTIASRLRPSTRARRGVRAARPTASKHRRDLAFARDVDGHRVGDDARRPPGCRRSAARAARRRRRRRPGRRRTRGG